MFVILWEFEVKPGNEACFENAYGPLGPWVQLFQRGPHFRGTQLLPDPSRPRFYFTLDFWDSEPDYVQFRRANQTAYDDLDRSHATLTLNERHILSFTCAPLPRPPREP